MMSKSFSRISDGYSFNRLYVGADLEIPGNNCRYPPAQPLIQLHKHKRLGHIIIPPLTHQSLHTQTIHAQHNNYYQRFKAKK